MEMVEAGNKEELERNRQLLLLREHFAKKQAVFEARQAKFLRLYPYVGDGESIDLSVFEAAVRNAGDLEKTAILAAFAQEKKYWSSAYVLNNCNCNIHVHIMNTLAAMDKVLAGISRPMGGKDTSAERKNRNLNVQRDTASWVGNNWGKTGEAAVEYVLKWLPDIYCVIEKDCVGKYSDHVILLGNPGFTDETQEFDHLVVGPQGVFNIETKNYAGKIYIDKSGNWMRLRKGETEWVSEENPAQQLFRHHVMLQSILGEHVPIIDVICMSHPSLMIAGQENSGIPIVKKDLLADFIVNYPSAGLSQSEIHAIRNRLNASKTNR